MSRVILLCCATLLGSFGTVSAHANDWEQARLACAAVGIEPGSAVFGDCVVDLYYTLWDEQNVSER